MPSRAAALATVATLATVAALAACSTPTGDDAGAGATASPDDIRVSVYQPRPDIAAGRIAIQVHDDGGEPVLVTAARLVSTGFADDLVWDAGPGSTVPAGLALDLRVPLAEADCDPDVVLEHRVLLEFTIDGVDGSGEFTPDDPFDLLPRLHAEACLGVRVAEVAGLTSARVESDGLPGHPAALVLAVAPAGVDDTVTIDSVLSTTLLAPADASGVGVSELPLGTVLAGDAEPGELRIPLVPNRCDPHALAEDKIGTRIPLLVETSNGDAGRLVLPATDELKSAMYAFFSSYCGLPA